MKKIKVLVVDDSPFILELIKDALDVEDIKVVGTADNAHQALQLFRTLKPHVVTMDMTLPDMDGLTCSREILARDPEARIILVSSMKDEMLLARGKIIGVKSFLQKPFKQYQLLLAIRQVCGAAGVEKRQNSLVEQFIQALKENLKEVANLDCKMEVYTDQEAKMVSQGMAVMVGLTGNQQGRLILDMVPETASRLAGRMFGKEIISEDNVINGLAELTNIIGGHSVSRINNMYRETEIRLTPPSVLMGRNMCLVNPRLNMTKVVAITEIGSLVMGIGFSGGVQ